MRMLKCITCHVMSIRFEARAETCSSSHFALETTLGGMGIYSIAIAVHFFKHHMRRPGSFAMYLSPDR